MILTATTLQRFMRCPRQFFHSQISGWRRKVRPDYVGIGVLFHEAMEKWARLGKEEAEKHIKASVSKIFADSLDVDDMNPENLKWAESILMGMIDGYPWPVHADYAEMEFKYPFKGHSLRGKVDGIRTIDGGRRVIFDYKTAGSLYRKDDAPLLKRDFQASFYFYLLSKIEKTPFEGVEFFFVKRSGLRLRKSKNEQWATYCRRIYNDYVDKKRRGDYYLRTVTFRDPRDETFFSNISWVVSELDRCVETDQWAMHETACGGYRACPYVPICNDDPEWERLYDNVGPDHHPELKGDDDAE
jgi:hypothetical protein